MNVARQNSQARVVVRAAAMVLRLSDRSGVGGGTVDEGVGAGEGGVERVMAQE